MSVTGSTRAPIGHSLFCSASPAECVPAGDRDVRVVLTQPKLTELDRVNRAVNNAIAPITDAELWGVAERWSYPVGQGDCEDYVLLKRRTLIQMGWAPSSLLITVVRDEKGAGHAVLTVATDRGDLVLDNQRESVLPWQSTGYEFIKRQSQSDPKSWVSVGPLNTDTGVGSTR